ncbi:ABC transporter permease [Georgenia sp. 10Sc9-8]|uniref:Transport permease protein n=1 Tax=Georgenia halotolerans TaxID=3028317 RepID=A0ABT5U1H5_9MICO|nr:ABC transporter permease [Georgenia halotolerans]
MSATANAARAGVRRGWTEFTKSLRAPEDIGYYVIGTTVFVVVMFLNRHNEMEGTGLTTAQFMLPGVLAFIVIFTAAFGLATAVTTEREDGTLLRMKSLPHGMVGYVVGQTARTSIEAVFNLVILAIPATLVIDALWVNGVSGVLHLLVLFALGLLACVPLGFVVGSVFKNPRSVGGWGMLVMGGLVMVSGVFFPILALPGWAQLVGQVTPLYWLGLGMREAILPDAVVALEISQSWRTLEVFGVLGAWAVVGLLLAPVLLRRMARRESGAAVEARRESALQRV